MCVESGVVAEDDGFPQNPSFSMEEEEGEPHHQNFFEQSAAMDMELQGQLNPEMEQCYNTNNIFIQELGVQYWNNSKNQADWEEEMVTLTTFPFPPLLPNPESFGLFEDLPNAADPSNLPIQREFFHSLLPQGTAYGFGGSSSSSLFDEVQDERSYQVLENGTSQPDLDHNGVFEFNGAMNVLGKNRSAKEAKHFACEKQRRVHFSDKFQALRKLIPNPTKNDRASIVGDAIEYINELKSTMTKLKILVEKKRGNRERMMKRQKTTECGSKDVKIEDDDDDDDMDLSQYNGTSALRSSSSWHHRKSENVEVDVRVFDDEVTVKLVQQKGTNCLVLIAKVLDELQLHLCHVAGGLIGDYYSFLFNSKIMFQGTKLYASAIVNKIIESIAPTS